MAEHKSPKELLEMLNLDNVATDERAAEILKAKADEIERWSIEDLGIASAVICRHALVVKLEHNKSMARRDYFIYKKERSKVSGLDDEVDSFSLKITEESQKRTLLYNMSEHLLEYANVLKKLYDRKSYEHSMHNRVQS
jgi:hypothetical protein